MSLEIDKEGKEEGVKRRVVTAHLVGREMFGKVLRKQPLSSHPLAMKDSSYPLPSGGQSPRGAQAQHAWDTGDIWQKRLQRRWWVLLWSQQPDGAVQGQMAPHGVFAMGRYRLLFTAW